MRQKSWWRPVALALLLGCPLSSLALDVHLQSLSPAPGLKPTAPLGALEGMTEAINCGLDFLNTAKKCGLSALKETASPFTVKFDPMFCRLTMRFNIGQLIDGMLKHWLAGAFAQLDTPFVGALCLLGIGAQYCPTGSSLSSTANSTTSSLAISPSNWLKAATARLNTHVSEQQALQDTLDQAASGSNAITTPAAPATTTTPPAETAKSATEEKRDGKTGLDTLLP